MNDKIAETVNDIKTPRLNDPKNYVLTHNHFKTHLILIFTDLNKAQIYKMPHRDSPHHENEMLTSFNYLNVF